MEHTPSSDKTKSHKGNLARAAELAAAIKSPEQRQRRQITRDVADMYSAIARAAGFSAREIQTAFAISCKLYERDDQPCDTPRGLSLAAIGAALASNEATGRNRAGYLFNHAIPKTGYQILTRFKSEEESGLPHEYADHLMPVAAVYAVLHAEEKSRILRDNGLTRKEKGIKIAESLERQAQEALDHLPKCDAELIAPDGGTYAYLSGPQAKAFCAMKADYTARPYKYTPPAAEEQKKPLCDEQKRRRIDKIANAIERELDEVLERNSFDEALQFAAKIEASVRKRISSWMKVADVREEKEETKELIHVSDFEGGGSVDVAADTHPTPHKPSSMEDVPPAKFVGVSADKLLDFSEIKNPAFEMPSEASGPTSDTSAVGPVNFDSALDGALFYARDGWAVLPICNYDPERGRCTADWHTKDPAKPCTGKIPLVKGSGGPGDGYTAATRDLGRIRYWFERKYPGAGVGLRLDGHALIDCDLKDGGPESYEYLRDTFDLPETLTAITQSGGRHYVFRLPDDLPADWLRSWTRVGDKIALPGIDLKIGKCGLLYAEPTRGKVGVYRWIDPTFPPATLPRECCDFLREIRYRDDQPPGEKSKAPKAARIYTPSEPAPFDSDQEKFFRNVRRGDGQHARLFKIACALRAQARASADQIAEALRYHAERFSEPLDDPKYIERTARQVAAQF